MVGARLSVNNNGALDSKAQLPQIHALGLELERCWQRGFRYTTTPIGFPLSRAVSRRDTRSAWAPYRTVRPHIAMPLSSPVLLSATAILRYMLGLRRLLHVHLSDCLRCAKKCARGHVSHCSCCPILSAPVRPSLNHLNLDTRICPRTDIILFFRVHRPRACTCAMPAATHQTAFPEQSGLSDLDQVTHALGG